MSGALSPLAPLRGVPATVVGGYLGSGKTTLINGWLAERPRPDWAVLVNDLGALPIDADRLRGQRTAVLAISGGCLCCSLRDGLGEALLRLARLERPPGHVVIECSGMAIPERLAAQLPLHGLRLERLVLVVDLPRIESLWHDPWVGDLVRRQFAGVDWLQLSKADQLAADEAERQRRWLRQVLAEQGAASPIPEVLEAPQLVRSDSWRQTRPLGREALLRWMEGLGPEVLRLKGEVWLVERSEGPVRLDRCGRQLRLADDPPQLWPSSLGRVGRLVAIRRAGVGEMRWPQD